MTSTTAAKMELRDGFLCVETTSGEGTQPVFLSSTETLLNVLGYAVPNNDTKLREDGFPRALPEEEFAKLHQKHEEEGAVVENDTEKDEEGPVEQEDESKKPDEIMQDENKEDVTKKEPSPEDVSFQTLIRVSNVANAVARCLNDIRGMKHRSDDRPLAETDGLSWKERRQRARDKALEKQQERLKKKHALEKGGADNNEGAQENADGMPEGTDVADPEKSLEELAVENRILTARTLNSLKVITPVLIFSFQHQRRNDYSLKIRSDSLKAKKNRACWFIGEYVYDVVTVKLIKSYYSLLQALLANIGTPFAEISSSSSAWKEQLDKAQNETLSLHNGNIPEPGKREDYHPLSLFADNIKANAENAAKVLDQKFFTVNESNGEEQKAYVESITILQNRLTTLIEPIYHNCKIEVYGSCLSDLSSGKESDVDLNMYIENLAKMKEEFEIGELKPAKYRGALRNAVFKICQGLESNTDEFRAMQPVARARVPVVRGTYISAKNPYSEDGSINFDICLLNEIAVANSSLIREYSSVDPRVKQLIVAVKKWASANTIASTRDNSLSSYTWTILVVFYLQCIGLVPNLQSEELMKKSNFKPDTSNNSHNINKFETSYLTWAQAKNSWHQPSDLQALPVTALLYGFFNFYAYSFTSTLRVASIKRGPDVFLPKTVFRRHGLFLCIEDPFETHDSHSPHDLGMHANEFAIARMVKCFQDSANYLRNALVSDTPDSIEQLWPKPENLVEGRGNRKERRGVGGIGNRNNQRRNRRGNDKQLGTDADGAEGGPRKRGGGVGRNRRKGQGKAQAEPKEQTEGAALTSDVEHTEDEAKTNSQRGRNRKNRNKGAKVGGDANGKDGIDSAGETTDDNEGVKQKGRRNNRNRKGRKGEHKSEEKDQTDAAADNEGVTLGQVDNNSTGQEDIATSGQDDNGATDEDEHGQSGGGDNKGNNRRNKSGPRKRGPRNTDSGANEGGVGSMGASNNNGNEGGGRNRMRGRGGRGGGRGGRGRGRPKDGEGTSTIANGPSGPSEGASSATEQMPAANSSTTPVE